ncbi:MAG: two-component system response regulator [Deltaproteobacteria bacterium RIFOXYD12_FULL_53_23]|nr:MAG: two-component system response regulator [Deltaproteobacteria bacterium RIFOXYD12_FULL_53_23]
MLQSMLGQWGWQTEGADDGSVAVEAVHLRPFDAILMDVRMVRMNGMEALRYIHAHNPAIPVVIMTAYSSVDDAVEAIKIGAHDYLTKPLDFERLKRTLNDALNHRQRRSNSASSEESKSTRHGIIGNSAAIKELLDLIDRVAPSTATVLITGESGTGKELVAAALHNLSPRRDQPLIKVNCAALTETLLESELFGHEKGAFTGADRRREGKFSQANNGTIFLDEIGETSAAMQAKLLRVLQEQEFQRVGGGETLRVDLRVLTATNRNLEDEVKNGRFREDLYYRLNVLSLPVPSLREHPEDIPLLVEFFLEKFTKKNRRQVAGITPGAMDLLINHPWPGNVRELENAIERGVILMRGDWLDEESLPLSLRHKQTEKTEAKQDATRTGFLAEAERQVIQNILNETGGNKSEASRRLNITRKTLLSKIQKYGLEQD